MGKSIVLSIGHPAQGNYRKIKSLTTLQTQQNYTEAQLKRKYPYLFNSRGKRFCEHADVTDKNVIKQILDIGHVDADIEYAEHMSISSLWVGDRVNLSLTLFIKDKDFTFPKSYQITSSGDEGQREACAIIDFVNQTISQ